MRELDSRQRFLIESCDVRGQLVHLDKTWTDANARTSYPARVQKVLGEAFVAATLLAGTIKFDGKMTLQVRGTGAVYLLVIQITNDGKLRGLARWHDEPATDHLIDVFGEDARMIITIEASRFSEPYQGIVALEGDNLAEALQGYFANSEQLQTKLHLSVSEDTAAGLLLQKLPGDEQQQSDDGWQRATILADSLTPEELRNDEAEHLLYSLYNQELVRVFDGARMRFECSCSRDRTSNMLIGLGEAEVKSIIEEQGIVEITCEFCDANYRYDPVDAIALFKDVSSTESQFKH